MFIVKNASQHQQPAENCANLFLHLLSCLFYVFFSLLCHGQLAKTKSSGKRLQQAERKQQQTDSMSIKPTLWLKGKTPKRKKYGGDRGSATSATKCLHLPARRRLVENRLAGVIRGPPAGLWLKLLHRVMKTKLMSGAVGQVGFPHPA